MDLRLVAISNARLAERYSGRRPVHPDHLARLESLNAKLLQLCRELSADLQIPLDDPSEELMDEFLGVINRRT